MRSAPGMVLRLTPPRVGFLRQRRPDRELLELLVRLRAVPHCFVEQARLILTHLDVRSLRRTAELRGVAVSTVRRWVERSNKSESDTPPRDGIEFPRIISRADSRKFLESPAALAFGQTDREFEQSRRLALLLLRSSELTGLAGVEAVLIAVLIDTLLT